MSFCPGCVQPDIELQKIKEEAKQYALKNQQTVAIYKTDKADYCFINAFHAFEQGYAVVAVVSHLV